MFLTVAGRRTELSQCENDGETSERYTQSHQIRVRDSAIIVVSHRPTLSRA
jgi:hypothetical protein